MGGSESEAGTHVQTVTYEALLTRPENIAAVQQQVRVIERIGGRVLIAPAAYDGLLVTVTLPVGYMPEQFFPDLPFYPV